MKRIRMFRSIHWRMIVVYILLILMAMQVIGAYFMKSLESHYVNNFTRMLDQQASLFSYSVQSYLDDVSMDEEDHTNENIQMLIEKLFSTPNVDIQVLDRNGVVIAASADKQNVVGQKNTQIEVSRALSGTRDEAIRINSSTGHRTKVLSLPILVEDEVVGAVYLMASMEEMYQTVQEINNILISGTLIALLLTIALGVPLAKTITSPIKEMTGQATAMAQGDFSGKVKIYGEDEIGQLARTFNELSERLSLALKENAEEKNRLASILFYMSDGVVATDRSGNMILMNRTAEQMLNIKEEEAIGLNVRQVIDLPLEHYRPDGEDLRHVIEVRSADGDWHMLQVNITTLKQDHNVQGYIAVLQDITQQERLERERKEFVANVSHELRTPLTTLRSYLEALEDGVIRDPELAPRFLQVTRNETERMIRLVSDLLQLSKMDSNKQPNKLQLIDMRDLILNVVERFSVSLQQREIELKLDLPEKSESLEADVDQLIQVLDNLLSNAIKYSHNRSRLWISVKQEEDHVHLMVKDEGVGIPAEDQKHIFKRFYRVDKARSREMGGTGLGLAIAKEMVEAHRGKIWVESEVGVGTTVHIRLPLLQSERRDHA